jgi:uncharacterized protein (DUF2249 family)
MDIVSLDNRGLLPPEPMVRVLRALETLRDDQTLVARMDREPLMLYPELERRGFVWEFAQGDFVLTVRRAMQG